MQTKKIGCTQKGSDTNKKDNANKKIGCKQKRQDANKKDRMQTKNQNLSRCKQKR